MTGRETLWGMRKRRAFSGKKYAAENERDAERGCEDYLMSESLMASLTTGVH